MCVRRLFALAPLVGVCLLGCGHAGGISSESTTSGTIRAARTGRLVTVEVGLADLPPTLDVLTLGLKLRDGTAVYPRAIEGLSAPSGELTGSPVAHFRMGDEAAPEGFRSRPDMRLGVVFDLDKGWESVDEGTFTLVLGDPAMSEGCRMGITAMLSARDGSPSLLSCIAMRPFGGDAMLALPPPPIQYVPSVAFRLREQARPHGRGPARVDIVASGTRRGLGAVRGPIALAWP